MRVERVPVFRLLVVIVLTFGLFGCDHATKFAAKATLRGAEAVQVAPAVFRGAVELRYAENEDVAFNALRALGLPRSPSVLIALSCLAIAVIVALAIASLRPRWRAAGDAEGRESAPTYPGASTHAGESTHAGAPTHAGASMHAGASAHADAPTPTHAGWAAPLGVALVLGGALGNVVDRIARGVVIDFIHVHGWPIFNVADVAVVGGMALLAFAHLRRPASSMRRA